MENLKNKNFIIVTHRSLMPCIPGDDLKKFLLTNGAKVLYITHPLILLKESKNLSSQFSIYEKNKLKKSSYAYHWILPEPLLMIKDFLYTLSWILKDNQIYDVYFGVNNLNAFCGLLLKKLGRVKKVVYYTIDLYPQRFPNKLINWLYHKIDRLCVQYSNETWNVSPFLTTFRAKKGAKGKKYSRQYTVPIGVWFHEIKKVSPEKISKNKIVYVGHLKNFYGVDLAIKALPQILSKIPNAYLDIIGGGEEMKKLKLLANSVNVNKNVKFYGWKEKKEAERIMSNAAVGLAPFNTTIIDEKVKNADPAKIKDYLSLGIPVVMTNASINANEIQKKKCGIVIDYNPQSLAKAVIFLLSNSLLREKYRKNALEYTKQFDWNFLFSKNISRLI